MCLCFASMYTTYLTGVQGSHKGVSNPLKLELQTVVNCHADAGNRTQVFHWFISLAPYFYSQTHSPPCKHFLPAKSSVSGLLNDFTLLKTQHYILLLINSKHLFKHLRYTSCDSHKHQVCFYLHHILMVFMVRSFVSTKLYSACLTLWILSTANNQPQAEKGLSFYNR